MTKEDWFADTSDSTADRTLSYAFNLVGDGSDYFERVEFLPTLTRHHTQNYVALCPNHAAMYQHANGSSPEKLRDMVIDLVGNNLSVILAMEEITIYLRPS